MNAPPEKKRGTPAGAPQVTTSHNAAARVSQAAPDAQATEWPTLPDGVRVFAALAPWWQLPWRGTLGQADAPHVPQRLPYLRDLIERDLIDARVGLALIARERVRQARDALKGRK